MEIKVDDELKGICESVVKENKTEEQWAEVESSDMFQVDPYQGGYESDEGAFCFSYYEANGKEYWFQITLKEVEEISQGHKDIIELWDVLQD